VLDRQLGTLRAFVDGTPVHQQPALLNGINPSATATIGDDFAVYRGRIDELRLYRAALSTAWVDAEHRSVAGEFYALGDVELAP
jgi:hypothetical protein